MEVYQAPQHFVVLLQVRQFVGVIEHEQARPFEIDEVIEQNFQSGGVHLGFLKLDLQLGRNLKQRPTNALLIDQPGTVLIVVAKAVEVVRGQGRFTDPSPAVYQQQGAGRSGLQLLANGRQLHFPPQKHLRN